MVNNDKNDDDKSLDYNDDGYDDDKFHRSKQAQQDDSNGQPNPPGECTFAFKTS